MIVKESPSVMQLFFASKGSVVPKILSQIITLTSLSVVIILLDTYVIKLPHISIQVMGVFGVALSLFLGFRNNAAYDRWWEARKLWGVIIADVRNLGRDLNIFVGKGEARESLLSYAVAYAHLHRGALRNLNVRKEILPWIGEEAADALLSKKNPADASLNVIAKKIKDLEQKDEISGYGLLTISQKLASFSEAQAGCERIKSTPLPFVYSLLVGRTTYLYLFLLPFALIDAASWFAPVFTAVVAYVFFGLQAVTNELERPFLNVQNGLPLDAMCRNIEISVCEALDRQPPDELKPKDHLLT